MKLPTLPFTLLGALLALAAACLFLPGLGGGFIFDDKPNIVENTALHLTHLSTEDLLYAAYSFQPGHGSRALPMLSFALDHWRGGLDARVFKGTNLAIHALTIWVLALFLRRLLTMAGWSERRATVGALAMALLWAVHPLQVSSVLYVVQRMQTLCTLWMVATLWAYLRMRQAQIEGLRSRRYAVLAVLFWALGFASKEDAVLLPLYAWVLEVTVLRFQAKSPVLAGALRKSYTALVALGAAAYLLVVVPYYWSWQAYEVREFSSLERLLTQGRVIAMYLGQIVLPLPSRLPFNYDHLAISRSLWQPATTLPALLLAAGLLTWAWAWRTRRPLFAFGVLFFFAGHFMTSNVIPLELAFEHRNHLPLVGAVIALCDLCVAAWQRWSLPPRALALLAACTVVAWGSATLWRAHDWGDPLRFSLTMVAATPHSERAWLQLGGVYASRSRSQPGHPDFDKVIAVNSAGADLTAAATLLSNVVIFKSIRGDVSKEDWSRFLERYEQVPMDVQNKNVVWMMLDNVDRGIPLDESGMVKTIDIASRRITLSATEHLKLAAYLHNKTHSPGKALPHLRKAVELSPPGDPAIARLLLQLDKAGRKAWVQELRSIKPSASP